MIGAKWGDEILASNNVYSAIEVPMTTRPRFLLRGIIGVYNQWGKWRPRTDLALAIAT
ncbi:uncharacterized protein G2W53_037176 [Senna tora]|uniref:Uncharacterized protein n=1 Tax=Senna tora TaxID=362788 RepID=A0A834SVS3_9FABA|nr:uncharacterized protein G2W53_037176 [Senna tora]